MKKEKGFSHFSFPIQNKQGKWEMSFPTSPLNQTRPNASLWMLINHKLPNDSAIGIVIDSSVSMMFPRWQIVHLFLKST